MSSGTDLAPRDPQTLAARHELTVEEIIAQADKIKEVMKRAMEPDVHYGYIPGAPKPSLLKPGAEKLCLLFRLDPQYQSMETHDGEHLTVKSVVTLWHIPSGMRFGSGEGSCSTRESKYAWRYAKRTCPECGAEAIGKSKAEYGGGWYCNKKAGGCGHGFKPGTAGAKAIEAQREVGKIPNPELADQYNTVLKMANKRALVAAVLNCTAASDLFTQDLEEDEEGAREETPARRREATARQDSEHADSGEPPPRGPDPEAVISENQVKRLSAIASGSKWTDEQLHAFLAGFGYASRKDIKVKDYDRIVERVKLKPGPNAKTAA